MNHLDLFSGIGGFSLGLKRVFDIKHTYYSEIDKYAIDVYKNNFKNITYVGSVTDVRGGELPGIDVITFGSPCQDFSMAGKRKGMDGARSSLISEAIRLIEECKPSFFIWENVKGTFSSNNGSDFWAIIQAFTNIGGYRLEWQLLNTSWFLPQNRERIYLVGYSTTSRGDWKGVFPIGKSTKQNNVVANQGVIHPKIIGYTRDSEGKVTDRHLKDEAGTIHASTGAGGNTDQFVKLDTKYNYKKVNETIEQNLNEFREGEARMMALHNRKVQDISPCLVEPHHNAASLFNGYRIRRLTPIECERLQGFPDNHTEYGNYDGVIKKMSNTQRYKQCGNAVTVDVVQAVAERMKDIL